MATVAVMVTAVHDHDRIVLHLGCPRRTVVAGESLHDAHGVAALLRVDASQPLELTLRNDMGAAEATARGDCQGSDEADEYRRAGGGHTRLRYNRRASATRSNPPDLLASSLGRCGARASDVTLGSRGGCRLEPPPPP